MVNRLFYWGYIENRRKRKLNKQRHLYEVEAMTKHEKKKKQNNNKKMLNVRNLEKLSEKSLRRKKY